MPHLISQPDSPPACLMGRNGIKEKTPSGSIKCPNETVGGGGCWDGDKAATIATQPSEYAGSRPSGQLHTEWQGYLATAIPTGYPVGNKYNNTPHTHTPS